MTELHGGSTTYIADSSSENRSSEKRIRFSAPLSLGQGADATEQRSITLLGDTHRIDGRYVYENVEIQNGSKTFSTNSTATNSDELSSSSVQNAQLYDRISSKASPDTLLAPEILDALADEMSNQSKSDATSSIPAIYTYFGQFIAHDITHVKRNRDDPTDPTNFRSHAFDLDSLFDVPGHYARGANAPSCIGNVCVGETRKTTDLPASYDDLARCAAGKPYVADRRNDNNLALSQLTVALIKFYQIVCAECKGLSSEEKKSITRGHIQSIVLYDYLPKIIDQYTYQDVKENGRSVVNSDSEASDFRVSVEFATGCFRFGHSMVRETYSWGAGAPGEKAHLSQILGFSHLDRITDLTGAENAKLPANWVADLSKLIEPAGSGDGHLASAIDTNLADSMEKLKISWFDKNDIPFEIQNDTLRLSLPKVTLRRALEQRVPSAQALYEHVQKKLATSSKTLGRFLSADEIKGSLDREEKLSDAWHHTPLWFYTLREAAVLGNSGNLLGPLASRVVMETIHAAICASKDSIISNHKKFSVLPKFQINGVPNEEFTLIRLLQIVENYEYKK